MTDTFRFIDLFAGVGGFHHALEGLGGECVLAVEWDSACREVYQAAFPEMEWVPDIREAQPAGGGPALVGDIRTITRNADGTDATPDEIRARVPAHDVLCAGFPCQPFSKSGGQLGVRDQTRGTLFFDIMEIVRAREPRFVVLENVPNLVGPRHRQTWRLIIDALREAGYRVSSEPVIVSPHRLPPQHGGSPQVRDRVFILAVRDPELAEGEIPPLVARPPFVGWDPAHWSLEHVLRHDGNGGDLRPVELMWLNAWDAFVKGIPDDALPGFPLWVDAWTEEPVIPPGTPAWKEEFLRKNSRFYVEHREFLDSWMEEAWDSAGTTVRDFPPSRRKFEWQARSVHRTRKGRTLWDLLIQLRPSGIRVKAPTYFPALVAITQTSIVGSQRRRLTPREAASLQQLPWEPFVRAGVDDAAIYKQVGNAVNVGVVRFVTKTLIETYGLHPSEQRDADVIQMPLIA